VIDFGYSTRFVNEDDFISVPKSWPWSAPEHDYDRLKPAQARKMDVFSFGMLCLWILFERCLSGIVPLPSEAHWAESYFQGKEKRDLSKRILEDLKQGDRLVMLAKQLVMAENELSNDTKQGDRLVMLAKQLVMAENELSNDTKQVLQQFFSMSLACNPNQRETDLKQPFGSLTPNQ
jgi:serine/threonine protein kinase